MSRSVESTMEVFIKHCESLIRDYEGESFLVVNLLGKNSSHEEVLTNCFRKLLEDSAPILEKKGGVGMKIDYDYFDFHSQYKKAGGAAMDQFVNEQLKNLYLDQI